MVTKKRRPATGQCFWCEHPGGKVCRVHDTEGEKVEVRLHEACRHQLEDWVRHRYQHKNYRRHELIHLNSTRALSPDEQTELDGLRAYVRGFLAKVSPPMREIPV